MKRKANVQHNSNRKVVHFPSRQVIVAYGAAVQKPQQCAGIGNVTYDELAVLLRLCKKPHTIAIGLALLVHTKKEGVKIRELCKWLDGRGFKPPQGKAETWCKWLAIEDQSVYRLFNKVKRQIFGPTRKSRQ